jgi:hypothetical protein
MSLGSYHILDVELNRCFLFMSLSARVRYRSGVEDAEASGKAFRLGAPESVQYVDFTSRGQDSDIVIVPYASASTRSVTLHATLWILRQSSSCLTNGTLNRVLHPLTPHLMLASCALAAKTSRSSTKLSRLPRH